jgi:hypothetical protein
MSAANTGTPAREKPSARTACHGLSRAGRAGHKSVPVCKFEREIFRLLALADEDLVIPEYASHHFTR